VAELSAGSRYEPGTRLTSQASTLEGPGVSSESVATVIDGIPLVEPRDVHRIGVLIGGSETDSRASELRSLPREMAVTKAS